MGLAESRTSEKEPRSVVLSGKAFGVAFEKTEVVFSGCLVLAAVEIKREILEGLSV